MRILRSLILPATILITVGGCATGGHFDGQGPTTADDIFFEFDNQGWSDVRVYIVTQAGVRRLVAHVGAGEKKSSNIPYSPRYGQWFHMAAVEKASGEEVYTPPMVVAPGDLVIWEILSAIELSGDKTYKLRIG